jgi:hypothetical protein
MFLAARFRAQHKLQFLIFVLAAFGPEGLIEFFGFSDILILMLAQ